LDQEVLPNANHIQLYQLTLEAKCKVRKSEKKSMGGIDVPKEKKEAKGNENCDRLMEQNGIQYNQKKRTEKDQDDGPLKKV